MIQDDCQGRRGLGYTLRIMLDDQCWEVRLITEMYRCTRGVLSASNETIVGSERDSSSRIENRAHLEC